MGEKFNHLKLREYVSLVTFMQAEYAKSGMNDPDFARYASAHVGAPIKVSHVQKVRTEYEIASNQRTAPATGERRVVELVERVEALESASKLYAQLLDRVDALERFNFAQYPDSKPRG